MRGVPKINTESVLVDLRRPNFNYEMVSGCPVIKLVQVRPRRPHERSFRWGKIALGVLGVPVVLALIFTASSFFWLGRVKELAAHKGERVVANLSESANFVRELDPRSAAELLRKNGEELGGVTGFFSDWKGRALAAGLGEVSPFFQSALALVRDVSNFNSLLLRFTEQMLVLQTNGMHYFQNDGSALIRTLSAVDNLVYEITSVLANIQNLSSRLEKTAAVFGKVNQKLSEDYLNNAAQFHELKNFMEGLIAFLDTKKDRRILLIFHNNSEMRPAGGFIGSYGILTVNSGQMTDLRVEDIYWPDHPTNFTLKVKPPEPLQWTVKDWAARDANWFFDFPASAEHVMNFLEASKVYKEKGLTFDGAVALNTDVLGSILTLVGDISVPDYGFGINSENFLTELQREVETGQDKEKGENPKKILSVIAPEILNRFSSLSETDRKALFGLITEHFRHKDIMIYMKDERVADFLKGAGVDGSVYSLPTNFWGSYLAVVNANVNGGKSDAFMSQEIRGRIDVATDGGAFTDLSVRRIHSGGRKKDPWYNVQNTNYLQVYTNPDAQLVSLYGNVARGRPRSIDYDAAGYAVDLFTEEIEQTSIFLTNFNAWSLKAFGKSVFALWFNMPAGQARELNMRYVTPAKNALIVKDGAEYELVFDRQSGVRTSLEVAVSAPIGYIWRESGKPVYVFQSVNPMARETISLHLVKQ